MQLVTNTGNILKNPSLPSPKRAEKINQPPIAKNLLWPKYILYSKKKSQHTHKRKRQILFPLSGCWPSFILLLSISIIKLFPYLKISQAVFNILKLEKISLLKNPFPTENMSHFYRTPRSSLHKLLIATDSRFKFALCFSFFLQQLSL